MFSQWVYLAYLFGFFFFQALFLLQLLLLNQFSVQHGNSLISTLEGQGLPKSASLLGLKCRKTGIKVTVPVLLWPCQAFLSLWYFKCHSVYFLSATVNLTAPGFPFMSMQCFFHHAVGSVWALAHLTGLGMDPSENNHLFFWDVLQMDQLSGQAHCLAAQTAWLAEQRGS